MSVEYKNDDFVLKFIDLGDVVQDAVNKYEAWLAAFTSADFAHVREAIKTTVAFFISQRYATTKELADFSYEANPAMQRKYATKGEYLDQLKIPDKKSVSIDLATGTGKSWVIFGVAQILLAEGFVDKVLVLCPSLTIEEELKAKFEMFCGDDTLTKILEELNARYPSPGIKSANVPILDGDICVENIHAAYERTGSSIEDSFKGRGGRTLVISDEAHHIYSGADASTKKWFDFLIHPDYGFQYLLGLTGTPYIEDDYFHDVIFRYGLQQAMDDGIVKKINYKVEESKTDKGWFETYANHLEQKRKYDGKLKPISIVVTDKIVTCVQVWNELVQFLMEQEKIGRAEAERKVTWVTSGLPSNKNEQAEVKRLLPDAEKVRKSNLLALKTIDEFESNVEWIISVSMLTEGWDVKNVFQIVPHEQRAFCSRLLISQVLGRGLRIPAGLEHPVYVTINNHERWTDEIRDLYRGVLETENRISWGVDPEKVQYLFPLYNLTYSSQQDTVETKEKQAGEPAKVVLQPQDEVRDEVSEYSETGTFRFRVEMRDKVRMRQAVREIKLFLKDHDEALAAKWTFQRIQKWIQKSLKTCGYKNEWVSRENLGRLKQAFGPVFRETGKSVPRMKLRPDGFAEIQMTDMRRQFFSESQLRNQKGYILFDDVSERVMQPDEKELFRQFAKGHHEYNTVCEHHVKFAGRNESEIRFYKDNIHGLPDLSAPQNLLFLGSMPEYTFARSAIENYRELFDSILKSPDRGFYEIPYSYKPTDKGTSHVRRENFNPDFLLKVKDQNRLLVVEIKDDHDNKKENQAKCRDAEEHFDQLNGILSANKINWTYHFYFLSPANYASFFNAVANGNWDWISELMQELSGDA